jgi:hypothetical protein
MKTIDVQVCGDHWLNPSDVLQQLTDSQQQKTITLNLQTEAPSLEALGVVDMVTKACNLHRELSNVYVIQWPNPVETVPFTHVDAPRLSHFFWLSHRYNVGALPVSTHQYRIGLFVGRRTFARGAMLKWAVEHSSNQFLVSCMSNRTLAPWQITQTGINLEQAQDWISNIEDFCSWWNSNALTSIDGRSVHQQYQAEYNTNQDLLAHYGKFDIELVAETYTLGTTFFPTEKTIRPIVGNKPFVVYGPVGHLQNLKNLGFKTYSDFWDEGYDNYQGPQRWQKIQQVLDHILTLPQHTIDQCLTIAEYNYQTLQSLIKKYQPQ